MIHPRLKMRRPRRLAIKLQIVALATIIFAATSPAWAARNDVVYLKNGDRVTCSVKKLDRGSLRVTTDHMGTVFIDWTQVGGIQASKTYEVELENGTVFYGSFAPGGEEGKLVVASGEKTEELPINEIVWVTEIKQGFIKKLNGSIEFGFNYQKSNNDLNYSISAATGYRTIKNEIDLTFSSILSNRNDSPRAFRNVLEGTYTYYLPRRWHVVGFAKAEQNDELGLDLRTNLGGGAGRWILQTNRSRFGFVGGLTTNREQYIGDPSRQTSVEAFANLGYDFFRHGDLGTDVALALTLYPSLTEDGRYRAELTMKYRQEIVTDLFVSLSGWYSFDNKAPVTPDTTVKQDDYGLVTSLGWEF